MILGPVRLTPPPCRRRLSAPRLKWLNGRDMGRGTRGPDTMATPALYMHGIANISSGGP